MSYPLRSRSCAPRLCALGGIFDPDQTAQEIVQLEQQVAAPDFWNNPQQASVRTREVKQLREFYDRWQRLAEEVGELHDLVVLFDDDSDSVHNNELRDEYDRLREQFDKMRLAALLDQKYDREGAFVSVHAGAGGTESCDWVRMLLRMYQRWCERRGYDNEIRDLQEAEGGIKAVTVEVSGLYGYGYLRGESGIHRLVRISPFDSAARRHTTFASVDVIPVINDQIVLDIKSDDIRVDTYRASGAGGQHVNKTDSAVRITHLETNIVVQCQNERSQHSNKENAMRMLRARLYRHYERQRQAEQDAMRSEKKDIAWGSQIRSYVFHPYKMIKDHRFNLESGKVDAVMDGDIDSFIEGFLLHR